MLPEVESLRVQFCGFLKKLYPLREEPDISSSIMNNKPCFHLAHYARIISLKYSSALNTRSNDFIHTYIERVMSCKRKNRFMSRCEG